MTVHVPVPKHIVAPDHPVKVESDAAVAVKTTVAPLETVAAQVDPQLIPEGEDVTVPVPAAPPLWAVPTLLAVSK